MTTSSPGIVVLGAPRTGTTLLRRLLDGHPDICCPGETFLLTSAARFLRPDYVSEGIEYGVLGGLAAAGLPREQALACAAHPGRGYASGALLHAPERRAGPARQRSTRSTCPKLSN